VVGTAGAVRHHQDQKYANQQAAGDQQAEMEQMAQQQAYQQQQLEAMQQQQAAPPPAPAPQAAGPDLTTQLQQLAQLHTAGVLSDEEFAAAKAKLLGG
jgi:type II secretory pathway component PulF